MCQQYVLISRLFLKPVYANPELKVAKNQYFAVFFLLPGFCLVWDIQTQTGEQAIQKETPPKRYKSDMKILANPGLA